MKKAFLFCLPLLSSLILYAQQPRDTGTFIEMKPGYYQNSILKGIETYENPATVKVPRKYFAADLSQQKLRNDLTKYTTYWRQPPQSQGRTGTCWSFGSTSMMESEIWRITGKSIKLSEMYTVYWEYVERAADFVRTRGQTYFAEGSESNALLRIMEKYGCVPYTAYPGMLPGQQVHDHEALVAAMEDYLQSVKEKNAWNEEVVTDNIQKILDSYLGKPPVTFGYNGVQTTPVEFMKSVCMVEPRDYVSFMSTLSQTFDQKGELVEADNWWHSKDYYNVRLEDFLLVIKSAIKAGYTMCICGDVSEPGYDRISQCGVIPTFDIPAEAIDENAREFRLFNQSTTDDHCMHLIGFLEQNGKTWFVLKDSGAGAYDGKWKGYRFVTEDYVRLKMMNVLVYKYGAKPVLDRIIK